MVEPVRRTCAPKTVWRGRRLRTPSWLLGECRMEEISVLGFMQPARGGVTHVRAIVEGKELMTRDNPLLDKYQASLHEAAGVWCGDQPTPRSWLVGSKPTELVGLGRTRENRALSADARTLSSKGAAEAVLGQDTIPCPHNTAGPSRQT